MPSPDYFLHAQDELMGMIDEFILLIIGDIARRIIKTEEVTETALHQMKIAEQSRLLRKDVVKRISQMSGYTEKEIERLFEEAGRISMDEETAVYKEAGMETHDLEDSNTLKSVLQSNLRKTLYDVSNLTLTTAVTAQTAFIQACNAAQIAVQSGGLGYDAAIARAIRQAASQGVTISYPSGHIDQLDVAVRRAVLTGTNQSCADINLQYAKEIGSDYVETTAHSGARPSHVVWQGKVFCISGKDPTYPSFYENTGYGTGPGLCGWNCRHSFHAFVPGVSTPAYTKEMLDGYTAKNISYNGKMYDEYQISQMQRLKERQIRETKRKLAGCDAARKEAKDAAVKERLRMEFEHNSVHLKRQESALKDFCKRTGRRYESARTQVRAVLDKKGNIVGFDRSVAQKAVGANKKYVEKYSKYQYNEDGTIKITDDWTKKGKVSIPRKYRPYAVVDTKTSYRNGYEQIDRTYYDSDGVMQKQIHSGHHNKPHTHHFGENNESFHAHDVRWDENGKRITILARTWNDAERITDIDLLRSKDE